MNIPLKLILKTAFILIIIWFISYFVFGEYISLEFADYQFAQIFPKILTFSAGASIYFLFMLAIKKSEGWRWLNILKFILGILIGILPFFLFKYYSSVANCQSWEVYKKEKAVLYESVTSSSEKIKLIETFCPEMDLRQEKTYRVMSITPLFNTISEIDTATIKNQNWKKIR